MTLQELKRILELYDEKAIPYVRIGLGTSLRIDKCIIKPASHNDNLFEIQSIEKDPMTGAPLFILERSNNPRK